MENDANALGYFFAGSPNLPLRQKIALAMLAKSRKSPQNLGEGIASVGQSFADAIMQRSLLDEDRAAMQQAATATVPPIADSAVPPTPPPQASVIPDNRPNIVPPQPPQARVIAPPAPGAPGTPLPPDQQQTYEPNAITRMPGRPGPPPAIPPGQPGNTGANTFLPPSAITTPVMAQGGAPAEVPPAEEARRAIAHAELRRQMGGAPPPAAAVPPRPTVADFGQPSALAPTPPPQAIPAAPQQQPIRAIPPPGPQQPEPIEGYVPPQPDKPQGAPTIRPGPQEQQLQALSMANAGNPYWPQSRPGQLLQALTAERERKQKEADKVFDAELSRGNKQSELNLTGRMDQPKRIEEVRKSRLEQRQIQQGLIDGGGDAGGPDPYIGTPKSRQRSGVPEMDPMPKGGIPEVHVKDQQKKLAADAEGLSVARPELKETLDLISQINAHPMKEASLGTAGGLTRLTAGGQGFAALHEQLKGKNLVAAYQKIKGTGPVGEREGENIAKAQAALTTASTKEDYDKAISTLETSLRGAVERAERKMRQPVTAYQKTPDDPYAPDIGQVGTRGGKKVEYIGGDPAKDSSYRAVR